MIATLMLALGALLEPASAATPPPEATPALAAQETAPEPGVPQPVVPPPVAPPPAAKPSPRPAPAAAPARAKAPPARPAADPAAAAGDPAARLFGFDDVRRIAQERSRREYRARADTLPQTLANLTADQYRDIRFRAGSALWRGQGLFEAEFFHRGYHNKERVNLFEVSPAGVTALLYNPNYYTFGSQKAPRVPANVGYAGFRVHYPLQTPGYKDELISFLGASYFRVLGRNQHYGASVRGLAIDTAAQSGEEFPVFTDFWLVRPRAVDRRLTLYALLDSKSVVGAYQFEVQPGAITLVEVHCTLYLRRPVAKLGIAPLTSMFLFGADTWGHRYDDYRPEVHDSDGLMSETGHGQWLWRPLVNPRELRVNRFMDENPRGFGLVQRERDPRQYDDLQSDYEARPSYWVQPLGNWGKGGVELVEIPSDEEIHDNIVTYWVPAEAPAVGKPVSYNYLVSAFLHNTQWPPGGHVISTRSGTPGSAEERARFGPGARRFVIEYAGGDLDGLAAVQPVKAEASADNARVDALAVQRTAAGGWRVSMVVTPRAKRPVDMHCFLTLNGEVLTETWTYQWTP
ncbi:MAG TPA: glucan biosynthesis protein G [Steroidobacteraceae bacterium]|nr:glucan biosynthesis protein G [Steroidobacteraceae bacterium]